MYVHRRYLGTLYLLLKSSVNVKTDLKIKSPKNVLERKWIKQNLCIYMESM